MISFLFNKLTHLWRLPYISKIIGRKRYVIVDRQKLTFSQRLINYNLWRLKINRNNMHTAGTGTKITTVFFFIFMIGMIC